MTAPCLLCRRPLHPTDTRTCVACVGLVRRQLRDLTRLWDVVTELPTDPPPTILDRTRNAQVEPPLPGGDLLVATGPGAPCGEGEPSDPYVVQQGLATWVRDWAETRSEDTLPAPTVDALCRWLSLRAGWASGHHDAFDAFATDLARMVEDLAGPAHLRSPAHTGAPCPYCRVPLRREWLDRVKRHECRGHADRCPWPYQHHGCADTGGLDDEWRCPRCHRRFPDAHYWLAVAAQLDELSQPEDDQERVKAG